MPMLAVELLRAAEIVAEKKEMKVAAKLSLEAAALTGLSTLVGGLVAGPVGLFIGGTIGGAASAAATMGKFRSVVSILAELSPRKKEQLCYHLRRALANVGANEVMGLAALVMSDDMLFLAIANGIKVFLEKEMNMKLEK